MARHFTFNVQDMSRATSYTDVIGIPPISPHNELVAGNIILSLEQGNILNRLSEQGYFHFAFQTSVNGAELSYKKLKYKRKEWSIMSPLSLKTGSRFTSKVLSAIL